MNSNDKPTEITTTTISYYNVSDSDNDSDEDNQVFRIKRKHQSPKRNLSPTESEIQDFISYYYGEAEGCGDNNDEDSYDEEADLQRSDVDSEGDLIGFIVKSSDEDDSSYEPTDSDSESEFESDMEYINDNNILKDKNINNNKNKIIIECDKEELANALLNSLKPFKKHLVKKSSENKEMSKDQAEAESEPEEILSD